MQAQTIRMTLTNALEGKSIRLNNRIFVDGICDFTGSEEECRNISKYFVSSYQVRVSMPSSEDVVGQAEARAKAIKEAEEAKAAAVAAAKAKKQAEEAERQAAEAERQAEEEAKAEAEAEAKRQAEEAEQQAKVPNDRQAAIIAAVNGTDKEEWVDKHAVAHPKTKDIQILMEDPTISKKEIVEVIETWLSE